MSAGASPDEVVLAGRADRAAPGAGRGIRLVSVEATLAAVAFAALCLAVLPVAPQMAGRDYMPTFTDASLIAAGSGALLLAVLATEASSRRRTWVGLAGFAAIEIATFVRYTNIVILGCAVVAVVAAWRLGAARLPLRTLCWWLASVAVFGAGVALFDDLVYGGPLTTGYQPGEVTFALGAIG